MKIALITNSRIPSLTANSIQAMKVAQALMQLGHEIRMFAPAEVEPVNYQSLITHYGLRFAPRLDLLPSIRLFKRFDFIVHAQRAAKNFNADLIYTWLPQSAVFALRRRKPVLENTRAQIGDGHGISVEKGFRTLDQPPV